MERQARQAARTATRSSASSQRTSTTPRIGRVRVNAPTKKK